MSDNEVDRELDAKVSTLVMGRPVVGTCCAIFVEGEWSLHPESSPEGWICYAGVEPVCVEHCNCATYPFKQSLDNIDEEDREYIEETNREWAEEFAADKARWGHSRNCLRVVPEYSSNIASAWLVMERLVELKYSPDVIHRGRGLWGCEIDRFSSIEINWPVRGIDSPAAPLAICLAALKVVEGT